mgnify:CR=1 FL=1
MNGLNQSLGMLEVIGMASAIACMDAMVKSAFVHVNKVERVGSGYICVMIEGDLASVQHAIEVGKNHCQGQLVAAKVIPRPYEGLEKWTAREIR